MCNEEGRSGREEEQREGNARKIGDGEYKSKTKFKV